MKTFQSMHRRQNRLAASVFLLMPMLFFIGGRAVGQGKTDEQLSGNRKLVVCLDFQPGLYPADEKALKSVIDRIPCRQSFFDLILVPTDCMAKDSCRAAADRLGGEMQCMDSEARKRLGILSAPSYVILDQSDDTLDTPGSKGTVLRHIPVESLQPTGILKITISGASGQEQLAAVHQNCRSVVYQFTNDTTMVLPIGQYDLKIADSTLTVATVRDGQNTVSVEVIIPARNNPTIQDYRGQTSQFDIQDQSKVIESPTSSTIPAGKRTSKPKSISTRRYFGPGYVGVDVGIQGFPYREKGRGLTKGLWSAGLSARYLGLISIQATTLFTTDSFKFDGLIAGGELTPTFLCIRDWLSLSGGGGLAWLTLNHVGPSEVRGSNDYLEPYVSASLFIGKLGRNTNQKKSRAGIVFQGLWQRPKIFPQMLGDGTIVESNNRVGGYTGALFLQFEV